MSAQHSPHALFVAYFFPPVGGVGVRRTLGFLAQLDALGWATGVIAPQTPAAEPKDIAGFEMIPHATLVNRTPAWEPRSYKVRNYVLAPDEWAGWVPYAIHAARHWEYARSADLVYATAPPYSSLLSARVMARALKVPFVADLRDPWSINLSFHRSGARAWLERRMERGIFRDAAAVIVNTEETATAYRELYPRFADKINVITNGFDRTGAPSSAPATEGPLTIVHAGTLAGTRVDAARAFLDGLRCAAESVPQGDIRVRFLGLLGTEAAELLGTHPAGHLIETPGFMSHPSVADELESADVLLLLANTEPETALHIPAKLYEYMQVGRPVLAIAGDGGIRRVIEETGIGQTISAESADEIGDAIVSLRTRKRQGKLDGDVDSAAVAAYDRTNLGIQLDALLRRVIAEHRR